MYNDVKEMLERMESEEAEAAMDMAVKECLDEGVLAEFLSAHLAEMKNVILTEYDEAKTMEILYIKRIYL